MTHNLAITLTAALQIGWNFAPAVIIAAVIGAGRGRWFRFVVGERAGGTLATCPECGRLVIWGQTCTCGEVVRA